MQFRQNMMTFATLLGSLRKGVTLMSVCEIEFRLKRNRQRVMLRVTVCALDVPINPRKCNARVLSHRVCWKFCCVRQNGRERGMGFLLTC